MAGKSPRYPVAAEEHEQGGAAWCGSTSSSEGESSESRSDGKRGLASATGRGDECANKRRTNPHSQVNPNPGATSNARSCPFILLPNSHSICTLSRLLPECTGDGKRPTGVKEALQATARRIGTYPQGNFAPSPPPLVLESITDEHILIAYGIVTGIAAEMKLSGAAEQRLLAWLMADARGATIVLDPPSADRAGKRLKKQALKVRADLDAAPLWAATERTRVHAEAEATSLRAELTAIDEAEQGMLTAPRTEVYIGFYELKDCGLRKPEPEPEPEPESEPESEVELPPKITETTPLPRALVRIWDADQISYFRRACISRGIRTDDLDDYPMLISMLVNLLHVAEVRAVSVEKCHDQELQSMRSCIEALHTDIEETSIYEAAILKHKDHEISRLRAALSVAEGREAALHEVIERHLRGNPPASWPLQG
jgi:hypothetical protein